MNITTLTTDLFESIKYISETAAQKYDNIIIGTVINDDNKSNNRYDVLINETVYKNLYNANDTKLQIDDQVYLIKLNNEDTKVVIGGLYYPNTQLFNNNLLNSFVRGNRSNLCNADFRGDTLSLKYDQSVLDGIWSDQSFTRLYFKATIMPKTNNIDLTKQLGVYGLNLKFSSVTETNKNEVINYEQTFDNFFSSNNLICNPYIISPEFGYTIEKVIDISNIPNVFNKLEFTKFVRDFSEDVNFDVDFIDIEIYLGFDIEELNGSKLFLGTKAVNNEEQIINSNLTFNDTDFTKLLALTYVNIDDDTQKLIEITDINEIKDAEIRWYKYSYGEVENDEYGGENWVLLDRAYETFTRQPIKTENGYYCLSQEGKDQQSLERTVNLNIKENKITYKAILIINDQPITSNEITFINENQSIDIQDTNLILSLDEYIENKSKNSLGEEVIVKTQEYYSGVYNIYEYGENLVNPPFVRMVVKSNLIVNDNIDAILWKIPLNSIFQNDYQQIKARNDEILKTEFGYQDSETALFYTYFEDENYVYFQHSLRPVANINLITENSETTVEKNQLTEYFELQLKKEYENFSTNTISCYLLSNTYSDLLNAYQEIYKNCPEDQTYQDYIDANDEYNNIIEGGKEIRLLGIAKNEEGNDTNFLLYSYYKSHTIRKTFYNGYKGVNGTNYQILLNFLPQEGYADTKQRTILAPNFPYIIIQGTLKCNGQTLNLSNYKSALADWVFPNEDYKLKAVELDYYSQLSSNGQVSGATQLLDSDYMALMDNKYSKFWLILPDCGLNIYKDIKNIDQIEEYYLDYIKKMGRYFRNALITLGYKYQFTDYKTFVYNHFTGFITDETERNNKTYFKAFLNYLNDISFEDVETNSAAFEEFWEELENKTSSIIIPTINKNAYQGILQPLLKAYDYSKNTLKTAYRCYRLCLEYLQNWNISEDFITEIESENGYGIYNYGPGKIVPTQYDKNKDLDVSSAYYDITQDNRLQILGAQFRHWLFNYNILNFKIPELGINKLKPIPVSTQEIDKDNIGFIGQLEIYYNNKGKILSNNKQHYNYNNTITPEQDANLYVTIQSDQNLYLNDNINYKQFHFFDNDLVIAGTQQTISKTQKFGTKKHGTIDDYIEIIYPQNYPTENNSTICVKASLLFGSVQGKTFYISAMVPLCLMVDRYGNNIINKDNMTTTLNQEDQKITSQMAIVGEKNNITQTYNGWFLNENGLEFYNNGQIYLSVENNILTLGPTGNEQITINPTKQQLIVKDGTINFSDLFNLINSIIKVKQLNIGNIALDGTNKKLSVDSDYLDGNNHELKLGNITLDGTNDKKLSIDSDYLDGNNHELKLGNFQLNGEEKNIYLDDQYLDENGKPTISNLHLTATYNTFSITKKYTNTTRTFTFDLTDGTLKLSDSGTGKTYTYNRTENS